MKKVVSILLIMMLMLGGLLPACAIDAKVRIMDLTHIKGVRENQLVGYGVVVGLPGTGDNSRSTQITNKMLLRNLGTVIEQENYIQKGASAAVIVTATVPPFSKNGDKIDVTVSAMADCKSLEGGVLVQTILKAPNGEAVAVAQGPLSVLIKLQAGLRLELQLLQPAEFRGGQLLNVIFIQKSEMKIQ